MICAVARPYLTRQSDKLTHVLQLLAVAKQHGAMTFLVNKVKWDETSLPKTDTRLGTGDQTFPHPHLTSPHK